LQIPGLMVEITARIDAVIWHVPLVSQLQLAGPCPYVRA
jgi:hypothetical protein